MNKLNFFAALCCAALLFAACDKDNEPLKQNDTSNDTKEAVDLGLSVKWATCNVGATKPTEYGNYYAWGETKTKSDYSWDTYKYDSADDDLTKYNTTDGKTTLEAADDAAAVNWGGKWRTPTYDEWTELREQCDWIWTDNYNNKGVAGYEVKSQINGNSIFLPAAGYRSSGGLVDAGSDGYYWSSSLLAVSSIFAWGVYFGSDYVDRLGITLYYGPSVRPVCE